MSNAIIAELLTVARKVNNYALDATTVSAWWPDTTHYKATVPSNKRWIVLGGIINRDANQTLKVYGYDSSGNIIYYLDTQAAAIALTTYPAYNLMGGRQLIMLDEAEYIQAVFGGAQGASAYATCVVLEVNM